MRLQTIRPTDIDPRCNWGRRLPALGTMAVNFEERVNYSRLHEYRIGRARSALEASEYGALLVFDVNNIRYLTDRSLQGFDAYVAVDASGTFSETKREVGLLRMLQAGVIVSDYASLMVEILKDNARPEAATVYGAMDMPWAKLVGQIAQAHGK